MLPQRVENKDGADSKTVVLRLLLGWLIRSDWSRSLHVGVRLLTSAKQPPSLVARTVVNAGCRVQLISRSDTIWLDELSVFVG